MKFAIWGFGGKKSKGEVWCLSTDKERKQARRRGSWLLVDTWFKRWRKTSWANVILAQDKAQVALGTFRGWARVWYPAVLSKSYAIVLISIIIREKCWMTSCLTRLPSEWSSASHSSFSSSATVAIACLPGLWRPTLNVIGCWLMCLVIRNQTYFSSFPWTTPAGRPRVHPWWP